MKDVLKELALSALFIIGVFLFALVCAYFKASQAMGKFFDIAVCIAFAIGTFCISQPLGVVVSIWMFFELRDNY